MRIYKKNSHFINTDGLLIKKYESNITTHRHSHDFIEIVYIISGDGTHEIVNIDFNISPGRFYIVKSGEVHNLSFSEVSVYYNIFLKEEFLSDILIGNNESNSILNFIQKLKGAEHSVYFDTEKCGLIESIFNNIFLESNKKQNCNPELIKNYLQLLFFEYQNALTNNSMQKQPDFILPRVVDYINMHYNKNLQISDIAQKYNYNPMYFGRMFQQHYGKSIKDYISDLRITAASELLITTNYNVAEICERVGYTNKHHFYEKFQKKFGCTPKEYKLKEIQNDNILAVTDNSPCFSSHRLLIPYAEWGKNIFNDGNYYTITVMDNKMNGMGINQNDTAIICKTISPKGGDIVAVSYENDDIVIRQLYTHPDEIGRYILHCSTKESEDQMDIYVENIKIYGVVAYVVHKLKTQKINYAI